MILYNFCSGIIDIRVTDLDSASSRTREPDKVLLSQETAKKNKYLAACEARRCSFTPFVVSTDGLFGTEAQKLLSHLATLLSNKQQRPYPPVKAKIMIRMSVALAKATHHCLRASRLRLRRPSSQHGAPPHPAPPDNFQSILWS